MVGSIQRYHFLKKLSYGSASWWSQPWKDDYKFLYFSGNKERDLVQITWYCRTDICWLILLRISNKALTEISKRLPFNQRSCSFLCLLPLPHPQHPTMSGCDAATWHTVTHRDTLWHTVTHVTHRDTRDTPWLQEIQGSLGHISGGSIRGRNRNEIKMIPKYSKWEKKEVRPFYYSEARLEFQSWLNLLNADLIATGSTSNSIPDSLIRPTRTAPSKPTVCPHLGAF